MMLIVFKPGPVQGPGSGFWPGYRVNLYFKKNSKRRRFSKKKKVNGLQPGVVGLLGYTGSWLVLFFYQLSLVLDPGQSGFD
jgi:hypothetical protein